MKAVLSLLPAAKEVDVASGDEHKAWFIVTQVKANRIVYFTDDPAYQPPMDGDWYFVSHFSGDLPQEMTLRNCWGWRFNGGVFKDVREPKIRPELERLLDSNRRALLGLLHEKVNKARSAWRSACDLGTEVRQRKLQQAVKFRSLESTSAHDVEELNLLRGVAIARSMTMSDAASLVISQDHEMWRELENTEHLRERFDVAIREAKSNEALITLRQQLLDEIWPETSREFAYPSMVTEPQDLSKPLSDVHRAHEVARLGAQLRQIINARRTFVHKQYVDDDTVLRHKARLAQAVLNKVEGGADLRLLDNFSRVHKLSLADSARLVLGTMNEAAQILVNTEITKDRMLAEIEGIENLRDVQRLGAALDALSQANKEDIE